MRFAEHHRLLTQRQHAPRTQTHVHKNRVKISAPHSTAPRHRTNRNPHRRSIISTRMPNCSSDTSNSSNHNAGSTARPRRRKLHQRHGAPSKVMQSAIYHRQHFGALRDRQSPGAPITLTCVRHASVSISVFTASPPPGSALPPCDGIHVHQHRNPRALALRSCEHERMRESNPAHPPDYVRALGRTTRLTR